MACRPATLAAAVVPVAVGSAVAQASSGFRWGPALGALSGALLLQILANFSNDVFDFQKGADTAERLGPTRVVQAGLLRPREIWVGIGVVIGLAVLIGIYLTWVAGAGIVVIGVASILAALAYTGGPYPLGYNGLGELFVFIFFGLVAVVGTSWVEAGSVPPLAWWAAFPVGALSSAILVVNNLRDRETDVKAGKRTLAVRLGRKAGIAEYGILLTTAQVVPIALFALAPSTSRLALGLPLLTLPWALQLMRRVALAPPGKPGAALLNPALVSTAKLLLAHGLLFSIAIVLAG